MVMCPCTFLSFILNSGIFRLCDDMDPTRSLLERCVEFLCECLHFKQQRIGGEDSWRCKHGSRGSRRTGWTYNHIFRCSGGPPLDLPLTARCVPHSGNPDRNG